jgi:hypothetical protein
MKFDVDGVHRNVSVQRTTLGFINRVLINVGSKPRYNKMRKWNSIETVSQRIIKHL